MAYIAATELPQNLWPEVIPTLVANVTNMQATEALKESSLEALGYICEELVSVVCLASHRSDPAFLVKVVNHSCVTFYSFLMYVYVIKFDQYLDFVMWIWVELVSTLILNTDDRMARLLCRLR